MMSETAGSFGMEQCNRKRTLIRAPNGQFAPTDVAGMIGVQQSTPFDKFNLKKCSGGAGGFGTLSDYNKFLSMVANNGVANNGNRVFEQRSIDLIRTNQLPNGMQSC